MDIQIEYTAQHIKFVLFEHSKFTLEFYFQLLQIKWSRHSEENDEATMGNFAN